MAAVKPILAVAAIFAMAATMAGCDQGTKIEPESKGGASSSPLLNGGQGQAGGANSNGVQRR